jgi:glycosyltransferase involved in cell wall biosynthesis
MRIFHLTAGTGSFYCGTCLRDNALVAGLRSLGHEAHMVPMYLPLVVDEPNTADKPVFFGGVNVYLQQASAFFRHTPRFLDALLDSPFVLNLASKQAGSSQASQLGALTLSMLQGENGHQLKELDRLATWFQTQQIGPHDWICLSNALLLGLGRRLKEKLGARIACTLQGEDTFLDAMPEPHRSQSWQELAVRAKEADALIAVSGYYADVMAKRLDLERSRIRVVWNGISLEGYDPVTPPAPPVLGYFARMCRDKGLHTLVDAFLAVRKVRADVKLVVGGAVTAADETFLAEQKEKLRAAGLESEAEFHPNVERDEKLALLRRMSVFSSPATYGEAFGLYAVEAMAMGVPVVEPRHAAFPELLGATGGGVLCEPDDARSLADAVLALLADEPRRQALGAAGRAAVHKGFNSERMAANYAEALEGSRLHAVG